MKFTIAERINLADVLPKKGNFETLIIVEDVTKKIVLTQEEITKYNVRTEGNKILWDSEEDKDIDFTEAEKTKIIEALKDRSNKNELEVYHIPLYKKFVSNPPSEVKEGEKK